MKSLSCFVVGLLLVSGFAAISIGNEADEKQEIVSLSFLEPYVVEGKTFVELEVEGTNNGIFYDGKPMLPVHMKTLNLPFGAKINDITCEIQEVNSMVLSEKIMPAPQPQIKSVTVSSAKTVMDEMVYNSDELFPDDWYSYNVGVGLDKNMEHKTLVTINSYPVRYSPGSDTVYYTENIDLKITYDDPGFNPFPTNVIYDLVIIAPSEFSNDLQPLIDHKNSFGVETILKTTEEIYSEYIGVDKPEQIKYFIKDALEDWGVKHVLLAGGLKSLIWAKPKDDRNHGASGWHLPVRYSNFQWDGSPSYNFTGGEPGYLCDLYYADIYKEGGEFDDWDSNGNDIFAEWSGDVRDELDLYPDVAFGRLAVRNNQEARDVINKIIDYEKQPADPSWFKRYIAISGDGFLDQEDWKIEWDTEGLSDGEYIICAQSKNPEGEKGPVDEIHITLDKTVETNITFNHDDHLKEELQDGYPAPPIAEILTISNGDTLGNTDYTYTPHGGEAYCNDLYWYANISYVDEVLIIRGKSYDPKPYGNITHIKVWINNSNEETIFTEWRNHTETYYEGEWIVGEKILRGRGGALAYIPEDWETSSVFTSNGIWYDQSDVIEEFSKGYGLAFFSGHGSPGWWGDHYPGIPGNRRYGQVAGLVVTQIRPYFPFLYFPLFPMTKLKNTNKLPVVSVGGCHNSMFYISLIPAILNRYQNNYMFTYGTPISECWGWHMVKMPKTGAIATMGNTGYGWGSEGDVCTIGTGDGWINTEFFRLYGEEEQHMLGMAYIGAISNYVTFHKTFEHVYWRHDYGWDGIDEKTVQQWQLLGDPSLKIGGYP